MKAEGVRFKEGENYIVRPGSKVLYRCHGCGSAFEWDDGSLWFGSWRNTMDDPTKLKFFCSHKCAGYPKSSEFSSLHGV